MVRGQNSLFFSADLDNSGLRSGANEALGIIQGLGSAIARANPFASLAAGALVAFSSIAKGAYELARDFEKSMKEVETISAAAQKDFKGISKAVFDLSAITPDDPQKLAKAFYSIVSAGYDGADGLKLLETAAKAAVAGVTDTETAADGLTTVLNAFKIGAEKSEDVADSLFNTVKLGKTTFGELASSISQVAPIAAASNIPLNEILSTVASLTKQGVPTAQAMTQIRAAIVGLQNAGSLDGSKTFQKNLQDIYDTFNGNQKTIKKELGTVEALQAVLAVSGKNAKEANKDLISYQRTMGATQKAFSSTMKGNIDQWSLLGNRIKVATEGLGNLVLGISTGLAKGLNSLFEETNRVSKAMEEERVRLLATEIKINDVNTTNEERIELIEELKKNYPGLLSNIDSETISNSQLRTAIQAVNDQLIDKITLQIKSEELEVAGRKAAEAALEKRESEGKLLEGIIKAEKALGIEAKANLSIAQRALEVQEKAQQRMQGQQNRNTSGIVNAPNVGTEISRFNQATEKSNELLAKYNEILQDREKLAKELGLNKSGTSNLATPIGTEPKIDIEGYKTYLEKRKDAYDTYIDQVNALGKKRADEINKDLLAQGNDYDSFLRSQLEKYKGNIEREKAIASAAASANIPGFVRDHNLEKVEVEVRPQVKDIELSENSISNFIRKIQDELSEGLSGADQGILGQITDIAEKQAVELQKAFTLKKLQLEKLDKYETDLDEAQKKKQKDNIVRQYEDTKAAILQKSNDLLEKIPEELINKVLQGTEISFQNLNAATLGQLDKLKDKLKAIQLDSKQLLDLGLDPEQVKLMIKYLDSLIDLDLGMINETKAGKKAEQYASAFKEVGALLSSAGDDITAAVGQMAGQIGNIISVMQTKGNGLQKASGIVSLALQGASLMNQIRIDNENKTVDAQRDVNKEINEQIRLETEINRIRAERAEIDRNSSAFLESFYKDDFNAAIQKQIDNEKKLNDSLTELSKNAIFTQEGIAKKKLFGTKREDRDFSIGQILSDFGIEDYYWGKDSWKAGFFDPLSIFGGYSDRKVSKDALKKIRQTFDETLEAMGKTSADIADLSTSEWLDFFTLMEASGHITDETTSELLSHAKEALSEYNDALEEMKTIISDFAGSLGESLGNSLVSAFQDGTNAAENFKKSVNDIINQLFLNQLIDTQFRSYFDDLQKEMTKSFEAGGDQSWIDDIRDFSGAIGPAMEAAVAAIAEFDKQSKAFGYDGFSTSDTQKETGLQGAIRREMTEETASELTGLFRGQYDLAKQHFQLMKQSFEIEMGSFDVTKQIMRHTAAIENNTANTVVELQKSGAHLQMAVTELRNITRNTKPSQSARDLGL